MVSTLRMCTALWRLATAPLAEQATDLRAFADWSTRRERLTMLISVVENGHWGLKLAVAIVSKCRLHESKGFIRSLEFPCPKLCLALYSLYRRRRRSAVVDQAHN